MVTRASAIVAVLCAAWLMNEPIGAADPDEAAKEVGLAALSWLSGAWVSENGNRRTEEHWTQPAGGTMFGVARTIKGERTVFFEYLRIEQTDTGIVYYASPKGRCPATTFTMTKISDRAVVFANPEHDYPQRIIYRRNDNGSLTARIEGTQNGRPRSAEWEWKRIENGDSE